MENTENEKPWYTQTWAKVSAVTSGAILILTLISNVVDIKEKIFGKKEIVKYDENLNSYCDDRFNFYFQYPCSWKNSVNANKIIRNASVLYINPKDFNVFLKFEAEYQIDIENDWYSTDSLFNDRIIGDNGVVKRSILFKNVSSDKIFYDDETKFATIVYEYFNDNRKIDIVEIETFTIINNEGKTPLLLTLQTFCPKSEYENYSDFFQKIHNSFILKNCNSVIKEKSKGKKQVNRTTYIDIFYNEIV